MCLECYLYAPTKKYEIQFPNNIIRKTSAQQASTPKEWFVPVIEDMSSEAGASSSRPVGLEGRVYLSQLSNAFAVHLPGGV
jgi:hypothetical protein